MSEKLLFKNILSPTLVKVMARNLKTVHSDFDEKGFQAMVLEQLELLELKPRAKWIAEALHRYLPNSFPAASDVLIRSMAIKPMDSELGKYPEFYFMPYSEFIAKYGVMHFDAGMKACYELTKVFTSEFCVRPFIDHYQERTLALLHTWASDDNLHVRRLVSEGTRPRLPWASRLPVFQKDPTPVLDLLETLKDDPELYVRRSVANNLNDITKDHPDRVIETLIRWKEVASEETRWIVRHASRTLIKAGHQEALILQGFNPNVQVEISNFKCSKTLDFGNALDFSFDLKNTGKKSENLVIDFVIYFVKANGQLAPKVFKLTNKKISSGERVNVQKRHPVKPITTRSYYPGNHKLVIQVNGSERAEAWFELVM